MAILFSKNILRKGEDRMERAKIESLCKEHGIKISALEHECHLGHGTLTKIKDPRESTLRKIADYFSISICELLDG